MDGGGACRPVHTGHRLTGDGSGSMEEGNFMRTRLLAIGLLFLGVLAASCSGPTEKKIRFFRNGQALHEKKDYVKASLEFKKVLQIDPEFADGYYMLGMTQLMLGDFSRAWGSFNKAVDLEPDHYKAQIQLGKILVAAGKRDEAMKKAELVLKKEPGNEEAQLIKGQVHLAEKENAKARAHLENLLEQGMKSPDLYLLLALTHMREKDFPGAERVLLKGIGEHGESVPLYRVLADVYAAAGRIEASAAQVRIMIELEPEKYSYRITLAGLYWNTGQQEKARELLQGLLAERPDDEAVQLDVNAL